jgi:hypothetical protein
MNDNLRHRLYMFIILQMESEKWATAIIGNVKQDFKMRLNNYMGASQQLRRYCDNFVDMEKVEDISEILSDMLDAIHSEKRDEFLSFVRAYLNGEVQILSDDKG